MKYLFCAICWLLSEQETLAQTDSTATRKTRKGIKAFFDKTKPRIPFDDMDLSWINGQNRQTHFPLQLLDKNGETILTGVVYMDGYYNYNFAHPQDNTHTISSTIGRHNEFTVNMASIR